MDFSIITTSLNMLPYLKLAAASIADQPGVSVEHIVADAVSSDGTPAWLENREGIICIIEKDKGMYDAINKGLARAQGDILAYLNCDEQYLPGTLAFVKEYFKNHPEVDVIFGDLILIRPDGSLVAFRKGYRPSWRYIVTSHLYVLSCTMFFRRRVIEAGHYFDTRFKAASDAHFVVNLLRGGYHARHIKKYFSAFIMTGKNLSTDAQALKEQKELLNIAPAYLRWGKPVMNAIRLTEKCLSGAYFQKKPLQYSVYIKENDTRRTAFSSDHPSFRWRFE